MYIKNILAFPNRYLMLLPVMILNLLPALLSSLSDSNRMIEVLLFALVVSTFTLIYVMWISKYNRLWVRVLSLAVGAGITAWYVNMFTPSYSNAYLAALIFVQLIFLVLGPRYGIAMLGCAVVAGTLDLLRHPSAGLLDTIYFIAVEAAVGILSWLFVSSANQMRAEAEESARAANASRNEAQRLADEVSKLNGMLLAAQDTERRRLARDIHDGPLQSMGVELMAVERIRRRLEMGQYDRACQELDFLRDLARDTVNDLRVTVNALRNTLLDTGIGPALLNLTRKIAENTGLNIETSVRLTGGRELPPALVTCMYHLATEGLNNITKHARAHNAAIEIEEKWGRIMFTIRDDGEGFNYEVCRDNALKHGHIGLYSMKERANEQQGAMSVTSAPGRGTILLFTFPAPGAPAEGRPELSLPAEQLHPAMVG